VAFYLLGGEWMRIATPPNRFGGKETLLDEDYCFFKLFLFVVIYYM